MENKFFVTDFPIKIQRFDDGTFFEFVPPQFPITEKEKSRIEKAFREKYDPAYKSKSRRVSEFISKIVRIILNQPQ